MIFTLLLPPCRRRVNSYTHPPHKTERREGGREGGRRGRRETGRTRFDDEPPERPGDQRPASSAALAGAAA